MSRLLFAAARGARIQADYKGEWYLATYYHLHSDIYDYRIHPEDAHLAYGPISTALRNAAAAGNSWDLTSEFGCMAMRYAGWHEQAWPLLSDLDRPLFFLILAEALADEGL